MHRLAERLPQACVRVLTFDMDGARAFDRGAHPSCRRVWAVGGTKMGKAWLNTRMIGEGVGFRPDVVLSGHVNTAPGAALLRRLGRIPFVQYLYADEFRVRPGLTHRAARDADAAVAVSSHTREMALGCGVAGDRVHVIPPGVDPPASGPRQPEELASRPTIVTVARLVDRYKGHDNLLRALPLIRARVPQVQWVVIGDGPLRAGLEQRALTLGLGDCTRFVGAVSDDERERWLRRSHVFAMVSRSPAGGAGGEGFGIVYLEAGARGLPIVAGRTGGALDAVQDGRTGLLVDPEDHVAVADAVASLLGDGARARAMGDAGVQWASTFSWDRTAGAVRDVLDTVSHQRRAQ